MFNLKKFGGIGLHRIERFYTEFEIDRHNLAQRSIVVTGSNGKGSTSHMVAAGLVANDLSVGCFTSPHMFDITERFQLNGEAIQKATFDALSQKVLAFNASLPINDRLGSFQFLFLVAILWFEETAPDVIVWEAGVGGRYDPVRTTCASIGAITAIELEHTEYLGKSEDLIAYDKTDAIAPNGTLILSRSVNPNLDLRIQAYCVLTNKTCVRVDDARSLNTVSNTIGGADFCYTNIRQEQVSGHINMIGAHQVHNAMTALALVQTWLEQNGKAFKREPVLTAMGKVKIPGRLQRVADDPPLWTDVGHTPNALDVVTQSYLELCDQKKTLVVFGVSTGKEVEKISSLVASRFDNVIVTCPYKNGAPVERLMTYFSKPGHISEPDICKAVETAKARAKADGLKVLAIGGLYLAAEVQWAWEGKDPAQLEFL